MKMSIRPICPTPPEWATGEVMKAFLFAVAAHSTQVRKYTGEPYIYHPIEVAQILVDSFSPAPRPAILCAALLHDVVEDCGITFTELQREFGDEVTILVMQLSDLVTPAQGNRATRKLLESERIRFASEDAQIIKIADGISNTISIVEHDKDFAVVYLSEKRRTLQAIAQSWFVDRRVPTCDPQSIAMLNRATEMVMLAKINLNQERGAVQ